MDMVHLLLGRCVDLCEDVVIGCGEMVEKLLVVLLLFVGLVLQVVGEKMDGLTVVEDFSNEGLVLELEEGSFSAEEG
jgi:hypothetical protein